MVSIVDLSEIPQNQLDSDDFMLISNLSASPASAGKVRLTTLHSFFNASIGSAFLTQADIDSAIQEVAAPAFTVTAGSGLLGGGTLDSLDTTITLSHDTSTGTSV